MAGREFGYFPLVSVRSGAPVSMPGMMDTILNVGLTDASLPEWAQRIGERAALDSYRRLIQMLGATAYGIDHDVFEFQLAKVKKEARHRPRPRAHGGAAGDAGERLQMGVQGSDRHRTSRRTAMTSCEAAIKAVFNSWMNERAIEYRKLNKIDEKMGTAVNVQAMVFGNMGDDSGHRACCSPATPRPAPRR